MNGRRFRTWHVLSCAIVFAISLVSVLSEPSQAGDSNTIGAPFEYGYTLHIAANSSFFRLYANGAPVVSNAKFRDRSETRPVEMALQHGENRIIVDYEPFDLDVQDYVPHEGIYLSLTLTQMKGFATGRTTLLTLRYSPGEESLVQVDPSSRQEGPQFALVTDVGIAPVEITYRKRLSDEHARRIQIDFTIDDPTLAALVWADAQGLPDTSETRQRAWELGQQLYQAYALQDTELWKSLNRPYLERLARSRGRDDLDELVKQLVERGTLTGSEEGAELLPFMTAEEAQTERLRPVADTRLFAFDRSPAEFAVPSRDYTRSVFFVFCETPEGLRVCYHQARP